MIPDQGTLSELAPAKLLLALHEQGKTGILYFRQNEILKVFYLNRGRISWAISSDEEDKIDHVLLSRKLVVPEVLAPYQAGNKIAESFGKVLVESGVISLEVLIQASREQVRRIGLSVLRWSSGNYQLVPEPPPTRLVSLDVDIPSLVSQYIMTQMDVNIIWEELGALSGELQLNADPSKKGLYALDPEQQGILSRFRTPQRLEAVLLDFPAEGKYGILKILYYFLLSGLLIRREAEKPQALDFNELDSLFGQSPASSAADVDIEMPSVIDEDAIQDIPQAELPERTVARTEKEPEPPALPDLMPPESIAEPAAAPAPLRKADGRDAQERLRHAPFRMPEKQRPRWLSITFISILVTAGLVGLFLWLTRSTGEPDPATARPVVEKKAAPPAGAGTEAKPPATAAATIANGAGQVEAQPAVGSETTPPPAATGGSEASSAAGSEAVLKQEAPAAATGSAHSLFVAGNYRAAGAAWRQEIIAQRITFSILLELDCQKSSVRSAYRQVSDAGNFFLLAKTNRDGRSCWLVLWGRYRTASEAELGLKLVPEYFRKQSNPPSVIELAPYL
jgi:hypothetical protein